MIITVINNHNVHIYSKNNNRNIADGNSNNNDNDIKRIVEILFCF